MSVPSKTPLSAVERLALKLARASNGEHAKALQYRFLRNISYHWMRPAMQPRTFVEGIDWLIAPPSDRGVLFACNHQTFFDAYLYLFSLYSRGAQWPQNLAFPVRSDFFYDNPLGLALNMSVVAGVMYPPIFRDPQKRDLNAEALDALAVLLEKPNSAVGMHPEGKRNHGDPYQLLPAQPGVGQVVLRSCPLVVPVFVNGLSNDFLGSVRSSLRSPKRKSPIIVVFGKPVDYSEFTASRPRAALYKKTADRIMEAITECGQTEKALREKILSREISTTDPRWLQPEKTDS